MEVRARAGLGPLVALHRTAPLGFHPRPLITFVYHYSHASYLSRILVRLSILYSQSDSFLCPISLLLYVPTRPIWACLYNLTPRSISPLFVYPLKTCLLRLEGATQHTPPTFAVDTHVPIGSPCWVRALSTKLAITRETET